MRARRASPSHGRPGRSDSAARRDAARESRKSASAPPPSSRSPPPSPQVVFLQGAVPLQATRAAGAPLLPPLGHLHRRLPPPPTSSLLPSSPPPQPSKLPTTAWRLSPPPLLAPHLAFASPRLPSFSADQAVALRCALRPAAQVPRLVHQPRRAALLRGAVRPPRRHPRRLGRHAHVLRVHRRRPLEGRVSRHPPPEQREARAQDTVQDSSESRVQ